MGEANIPDILPFQAETITNPVPGNDSIGTMSLGMNGMGGLLESVISPDF